MNKLRRRRFLGLIVAFTLMISACTASQPGGEQPPTTQAPVTFPIPDDCDTTDVASPFIFDLDNDGLEEIIFIDTSSDQPSLVVCIDDDSLALGLEGSAPEVAGFVDLTGNGTTDILLRTATDAGFEMRAATLTLRGLRLTSLVLEQWATETNGPDEPFEGASFQCVDWDEDGDIELVHRRFMPVEAEVNINTSLVEVDGLDAVEGPLDSYEEEAGLARRIWSAADGCAPGTSAPKEVRFSSLGWAKAPLDPQLFTDKDDIVLTAVAQNNGVVAAVGTEAPNIAVGILVEARPLAWWSNDGLSWTEADVEGTDAEILDVISYQGGFLAVGRAATNPAVWQSADGSAWELTSLDTNLDGGHGVIYSLAEVDGELVAVGAENYWSDNGHADSDAAIWRSEDGRSWSRVTSPSLGTRGYQPNTGDEFNGAIFDIAHDPSLGLVAVGYDSDTDPVIDFPDQFPAVWSSADGSEWRRQRIDHDVRLNGIVHANDLLVAYGSTNLHGSPTADAAILISSDGVVWSAAQGSFGAIEGEEDGIQGINAIRQAPDGTWLALGSDQIEFESRGATAVWRSTDVITWTRMAHDTEAFGVVDETPAPFVLDAVAMDDGLLVAVGASGLTVELTGGGTVCCLYRPHIVAFDPMKAEDQ